MGFDVATGSGVPTGKDELKERNMIMFKALRNGILAAMAAALVLTVIVLLLDMGIRLLSWGSRKYARKA